MKTAKLWLRNTSRYDDREAFILCRTARESVERGLTQGQTLPPVIVKLTNSSDSWSGRAYWTELHVEKGVGYKRWHRVLVRIGSPERLAAPRSVRDGRFKGDMPDYEIAGYREALVMVAAHEMEHAAGAPGGYDGEFRCELAAADAVDYYRANRDKVDGEIEYWAQRRDRAEAMRRHDRVLDKDPLTQAARKLAAADKKLAQWKRRLKLATTKTKHYQRAVKRLELRVSGLTEQPLEQAAKGKQ